MNLLQKEIEKEKLAMKLLTKEVEKKFERFPTYSQESEGMEATVLVKFFNPTGVGTWLITEAEKQKDGDWLLFGYCELGHEWEWGYVTLSELQNFRGRWGLGIERDLFTPSNAKVKDLAR